MLQGSGSGGHGRAAPLWSKAAGTPGGEGGQSSCAGHERHPHSQDTGHYPLRGSEHLRGGRTAGQPSAHQKLRGKYLLAPECLQIHHRRGGEGEAGICYLPPGRRGSGGRPGDGFHGECDGLFRKAQGSPAGDPGGIPPRENAPWGQEQNYGGFCRPLH